MNSTAIVIASKKQVVLVLVNSISKAIKFLLAKGCIDLHNYVQDSEIIINITSDALGLCQSDQGHILDWFY